METMTQIEFKENILPTIGRVTSISHLQNIINNIIENTFIVKRLGGFSDPIMNVPVTIPYDIFYCYISSDIYVDWMIHNKNHSKVDIHFKFINPGVYKVNIR